MAEIPSFNHENPQTVFDILWSWSTGYLSTAEAIRQMDLDDEMELYEVCLSNDVPFPGTPSEEDLRMADEFLQAITFAA